ncbi:hypothetical protein SR914_21320 [Comamonas testosteroni]|uniref:Lipoprotein n=1 Tax=Comamonas testosteroni (strain DSM 14576 / KF-1) TaxID=399795 RepID=B7WUM9_COMTK|nr:hypothetical protein [Comamonas testosteroni]EED67542.1 hypothetical protein CtesDRAFT_PD2488 [Comamonas testosteroni KF-1]WQG65689.1 hypothetical protein SR914_21320 [Comamonas testosteroni]
MKKYLFITSVILLSACGQATPPSLEKTDAKAIAEFNNKYKPNEYVKFSIIKKERIEITPSDSDKYIYNVKYRIAFQQDFDYYKNLMDRVRENEEILDPHGAYKQLAGVNRNPFNDGVRIIASAANLFSSKEAREIIQTVELNEKFLKENEDLAQSLYKGCKSCVDYINQSQDDKDYQSLKKIALAHAILSFIKDKTYQIPPSGIDEETIVFQIENNN